MKYRKKKHIITAQRENEQAFLKEFSEGTWTVQNPLVKLNPYMLAPLTAMVLFRTGVPAEVTVTVSGKETAGNVVHTFPAQCEHILPVYGLYADTANHVLLTLSTGERGEVVIRTGPMNERVPQPTRCETDPVYMGDQMMWLTAAVRSKPVAVDYRGDIRWYSDANLNFALKRLPNGHLLVGTERLTGLPYYTTGLYEMAVSGKVFREYRLPGGYHHDQFVMEDGNILVLTQDADAPTVEDVCVLIHKDTGEILKRWDYKSVLPQNCGKSGSWDDRDWFHNNSIWYEKDTNSLTISGRHQDVVINLDYDTGALNWVLGDPDEWPEDFVSRYFLKPEGEPFEYQYEQHGVIYTPNGDLMLFDNGHFRSKYPEKYQKAADSYSRGVRYRIDHKNHTVRQVWEYGRERGSDFFSPYISNVEYYAEDRYMVHSGGIAYIDGKPSEELGSMALMGPDKDKLTLNSITCELVDGQVVYELEVPANCYRARKLPLYYAGETAQLGEGQLLGTLGITEEFETEIPAEAAGEQLPEGCQASVTEEEDRIRFNAKFEKGELVMLLLTEDSGKVHRYYISTSATSFKAMCVGTFQKSDSRETDKFISKEGLHGKMKVQVIRDGILYETGVTVTGE